MKKLSVVVIAILALAGSLTAYSSLIPKVPVESDTDDLIVSDVTELTSSLSSSEKTMADELTEAPGTDADSMSSSNTSLSSLSSSTVAVEQKPSQKTAYLAYADGIIGNGETSLLFFHASWCPSCKQSDNDLKALYNAGTPTFNTYRVDYDASLDLRKRYGVVQQHTFVLIDGKGTALQTLLSATSEELTRLLR
jgi:thiol-disulfide isomerase/thioredoxin